VSFISLSLVPNFHKQFVIMAETIQVSAQLLGILALKNVLNHVLQARFGPEIVG
jgi:hypothetical protein